MSKMKMKTLKLISVLLVAMIAQCASATTMTLSGSIRDFSDRHPDFEIPWATTPFGHDIGVVGSTLGSDGTPVYVGPGSTGSTSGAANFNWFTDNTHLFNYDITLNWDGDSWMYSNDDFFPIDDLGYGNEGRNHNFHFTYQIHNSFTYQAGTGQYVEVAGDDDIWLFLNKGLAIDLGGISGATPDIVFLDSLGLTDGSSYDFDLFFAERHTLNSGLHIDTNIFPAVPEPATMAMLFSGLMGFGFLKRRKTV